MPVIPNDATSNVEYVSGGAYCIRTKTTPHLYWSVGDGNNGFITLDTRKETKFRINRDDSGKPKPAPEMIVVSLKGKTTSNYLH
jgi:hypothetical protein